MQDVIRADGATDGSEALRDQEPAVVCVRATSDDFSLIFREYAQRRAQELV